MTKNLPKQIPIFPLSGVIYFPNTNLPLNIFEKRYLDLINDTYNKDKLMGMVQSKKNRTEVYKIGCLGKISDYQKSKDGRILINLTGITRFEILEEIENQKAKGKIFPFGVFHLLKAKRNPKTVTSYLIGVAPEYQNKGITAIIFSDFTTSFNAIGVDTIIRTPELEDNIAIHQLWKNFDPQTHKRRRTYKKNI